MARADLYARFEALDRKLVAAGFPPTSEWWRAQIARFLRSGRWQLVARVGRRGGKSSTLCRLAVLLAMQDWPIPPGDVGFVLFISARLEDANARLVTIEAILRALRIPFRRRDTTLELEGRPIAFRVIPATIAAASGPTTIAVVADEVAKWRDHDTGANPAEEVLAAVRPTMATMARHGARMVLSSSPFGPNDAHARAFDLGETDEQIVAFAETWIANPTLTEAETHKLEPDAKKWAREYAAIPSASVSAAFETEDVAACFRAQPAGVVKGEPVLVVDPSSGRGDAFTWAIVRWALRLRAGVPVMWRAWIDGVPYDRPHEGGGTPSWAFVAGDPRNAQLYSPVMPRANDAAVEDAVAVVEEIGGVDQKFDAGAGRAVYDAAARDAKRWGCRRAYGDQREMLSAHAEFHRRSIAYEAITWTAESKRVAVELVRRWMADRRLVLPAHDKLRAQLLAFESRILPSGYETYAGRRGSHDDYAALVLTAAMAENEGFLPRSPHRSGPARGVVAGYDRF